MWAPSDKLGEEEKGGGGGGEGGFTGRSTVTLDFLIIKSYCNSM